MDWKGFGRNLSLAFPGGSEEDLEESQLGYLVFG
jgi:hypothetical protein